jgi:6-phosphofructokinase 2
MTSLPAPDLRRPRIVTLTMNPALDLACTATEVKPTHKIRTFEERYDPGGGGINVARVVHALGGNALALIMTGGVIGHFVEELLDEAGIRWQNLPMRGRTRISLNVHDRHGNVEYRFVPEGPHVSVEEWGHVLEVLRETEAEWIVASGSLPRGVPSDFYAQAAALTTDLGRKFVLDTSGPALGAAIGHGIELLKLSLGELEYLSGRELRHPQLLEQELAALIRAEAARMVAVSLGRDGAIFATDDGILRLPAIKVEERSAVGAGAAAVATYGTARVDRADVEMLHRTTFGTTDSVIKDTQ